jgi:hypothetical protein
VLNCAVLLTSGLSQILEARNTLDSRGFALIPQFRPEPLARGRKAKFALWWKTAENRGNRSVLAIARLSLGRETSERPDK